MSHLQLGFIIGLFGSLHCVGMCGPLAFAVPSNAKHKWVLLLEKLSYQIGRAVSYAILGLLIGYIGKNLWLAGLQQIISVVCGALIVMLAVYQLWQKKKDLFIQFNWINNAISKAIQLSYGHFLIGMLNGLLPCGFVYLALATAINSSNVLQSGLFMFFFGLGTLPLMFFSAVGLGLATPNFRNKINKILPFLTLLLGVWFILRGLALDIPFLSPVLMGNGAICR